MNRDRVGGLLDLAALSALSREQHRPADTESLQAEVRRLHRAGHSALWIAESLRIDRRQVEQLLKAAA